MSNNSYKTIIKTTGLIGLVQVFQMVFGLIRNKALAIIVGTQGFGIWGLYNSYIEMLTQISLFGLDQSGVRQIAQHSDNKTKVGKTIFIFKWTIIIITSFATISSVLLSKTISKTLFGTSDFYIGVIVVSLAIFFNGISRGQRSILNGFRNLKALAYSQIIGAVAGSIIAILFVYFLKSEGIAYYVLAVSVVAAVSSSFFVKRMNISSPIPSSTEFKTELKTLFSVGIGFSIAGIIATIMTYFSRLYLINEFNLEAVGIYQSSWTISNLYIGTILTAMGVDFMPRLMKVSNDNKEINRLVNEQMELGLLAAGIGVIALLVFSPLILKILYSHEFLKGTTIIRWQVLGVSLRVLAFPFSYAIMAKGKSIIYILVQGTFWITEYFLLVLFSKLYGFDGLGINYFIGYTLYFLMTLIACKYLFKFRFSKLLKSIMLYSYIVIGITFAITFLFPPLYSTTIGLFILSISLFVIHRILTNKMNINVIDLIKHRVFKKYGN